MPIPEQDFGRHLCRLDEPDAVVARPERVLELVLEADVAERPLVALDQLGGVLGGNSIDSGRFWGWFSGHFWGQFLGHFSERHSMGNFAV